MTTVSAWSSPASLRVCGRQQVVSWQVGWLVGWHACSYAGWLAGWWAGELAGCFAVCLSGWLSGWLNLLDCWLVKVLLACIKVLKTFFFSRPGTKRLLGVVRYVAPKEDGKSTEGMRRKWSWVGRRGVGGEGILRCCTRAHVPRAC
eukprot:354410-Chlamydomonas_euryale.AAC.3